MGARRIIIVSATATTYGPPMPPDPDYSVPDLADAGAQVLEAMLADRLAEDVLAIRRSNRMIAQWLRAPRHPGNERCGTATAQPTG